MALLESTKSQRAAIRTAARPRLEPLEVSFLGRVLDAFEMRSEDVRFSPSGRLLAVLATQGKILLFTVDTIARPVRAEFLTALVSSDLQAPHGLDWIDEETLVVANRRAGIAFLRVPRVHQWELETEIAAFTTVQPHWFGAPGEMRPLPTRSIMTGPGSVRIHGESIYVTCNKANTVTRHRLLEGPSCDEGTLAAQEGIEIPDSVAITRDGAWLAVSDHGHSRVLIFRPGETSPCGQLSDPGLRHPHGLAMVRNGKLLIVADAGGRGLYVFYAPDGTWDVVQTAAASQTEGVAEAVFDRVRSETPEIVRALEGGTKGVDVSKDDRVVVSTCRGQTLRFYAIHAGI